MKGRSWKPGPAAGMALCLAASLCAGCDCRDGDAGADAEEKKRYCEDQDSWTQWDALLERYRFDDDMIALYAMRLGVCSMIMTDRLEVARAERIMEAEHTALVTKWVRQTTALDRNRRQLQTETDPAGAAGQGSEPPAAEQEAEKAAGQAVEKETE